MRWRQASVMPIFIGLIVFCYGCVYVGSQTGTDHATVYGGTVTVTVSPTMTFSVPVSVGIGDKVAEAAANAAVGYLKGLPGAMTAINRAEAVQKGVAAGVIKAGEIGQPVDQKTLETFVQQVVAKI